MLPLAVCLVEKFFFCSSLVSIIKTMTKANLGGGWNVCSFCSHFHITCHHQGKSEQEIKQEPGGKN